MEVAVLVLVFAVLLVVITVLARYGVKFKIKASTRKFLMQEMINRVTFSNIGDQTLATCTGESNRDEQSNGGCDDGGGSSPLTQETESIDNKRSSSSTITELPKAATRIEDAFATAFLSKCPDVLAISQVDSSKNNAGLFTCPAKRCTYTNALKNSMMSHVRYHICKK